LTATADYAAALIPELQKLVDLRVFEAPPKNFDPDAFDAILYLIGNTAAELWIYQAALRYPGIVVLCDADLHDVVRELTKGTPEAYFREVFYEVFGQEWDSAQQSGLDVSGQQPRTFSMLRRLLDSSKGCIVSSRYLEGAVRMKGFRGNVARIPRGTLIRNVDGTECRARLGLDKDQPLIGIFGDWWTDEQIHECLGVFHILAGAIPDARMIIAAGGTPESSPENRIRELGLDGRVRLMKTSSQAETDGFIAACDVVLNAQWRQSGEASAMSLRAFGLGKTVVTADYGVAKEWPNDICARIPDGRFRDQVLYETLKWLLSSPQVTSEIGAAAARWAAENCTWEHTARLYADFLASCKNPARDASGRAGSLTDNALQGYLRRWVEPATDREHYLNGHETRLIRTLQLTPEGTASDRILEMGCYLQLTPALRNVLGYGQVRGCYFGDGGSDLKLANARDGEFFECTIDLFNCESDPFPYPDGHFSTVLCCELLEHLKHDPMGMMSEINRILKPGGILLLTTPNVVSLRAVRAVLNGVHPGFYNRYPDPRASGTTDSRHEREYTPGEISQLLDAAGFAIDHIETGPYGVDSPGEPGGSAKWAANVLETLKQPVDLRDDCILAVGRKESVPGDLRPFWLYDSATLEPEPR
jgi:SAM-dependent methyltransferase